MAKIIFAFYPFHPGPGTEGPDFRSMAAKPRGELGLRCPRLSRERGCLGLLSGAGEGQTLSIPFCIGEMKLCVLRSLVLLFGPETVLLTCLLAAHNQTKLREALTEAEI